MNEYEINEDTLAIVPEKNKSRVYETHSSFVINQPVSTIVERSCEYFGSSFDGRLRGTSNLIGVTHKAPIIIEETKELIFFPTTSPRLNKCSWISLRNINRYYREKEKMYIEFKNNQKMVFDVSYGVIDNQILRATRLESVLRQRKTKNAKNKGKKM